MFKKFLIIFFFLFYNTNLSYSDDKVFYIDLDEVLSKTVLGSSIVSELNAINEKNLQNLKSKEQEIKKKEGELKTKKNIITKEEFEIEVKKFNQNINAFKKEKENLVKIFKTTQNEKIKNFFIKINPIIQKYMEEKSINILLDRKYVFIGKDSNDITSEIILLIDKTIKK
tara:strand:- start:486 stop:995 length:510 start_codon:yes stop_codon:yes gene_type:complete